jgi:hypothetical protein
MHSYNRMTNDKVTTIIAADYMYLVFLGDDNIMEKIVDKLNKDVNETIETLKNNKTYKSSKVQQRIIYMKSDISSPCIDILESDHILEILRNDAIDNIKKIKKNIKLNIDEISEQDIDVNKKYVTPDEGVETAQCLTYADVSCNDTTISKRKTNINNLMMLMVIVDTDSHYKLGYPILQLDEEENPDKLISKWLKDHSLEDLVRELTIRPINIVGNDHDILVFAAFVNE